MKILGKPSQFKHVVIFLLIAMILIQYPLDRKQVVILLVVVLIEFVFVLFDWSIKRRENRGASNEDL